MSPNNLALAGERTPLLAVQALCKHFGATRALDGVDFDLFPGEVHALCGENGAGKSTFVRILSGMLTADSGEIRWGANASSSTEHLAVIHQDFDLAPNLTVGQNLVLGREPRRWRMLVDCTQAQAQVRKSLARVGLDVDPNRLTRFLPAAQRQLLAVARALSLEARVLVMDEPTSFLDPDDTRNLLQLVDRLRSRGVSVIFISHKLEEVFSIADRITVLRDGRSMACLHAGQTSQAEVIDLMVGRELGERLDREHREPGAVLLEARGLSSRADLVDINFELRGGEILGVYGLQGSGRTRLAETLFGLTPADQGDILLNGKCIQIDTPQAAMRLGIVLVPEDRKANGLFFNMNIRENLTLARLDDLCRSWLIDPKAEQAAAADAASAMTVRLAGLEQSVQELSGGNQQKVLLARWLIRAPRLLILDEPTAGVDVGAKADIYARLDVLAGRGIGILMITSELPELLGICDRVMVMNEGAIVARFAPGEADEAGIMKAIQDA